MILAYRRREEKESDRLLQERNSSQIKDLEGGGGIQVVEGAGRVDQMEVERRKRGDQCRQYLSLMPRGK